MMASRYQSRGMPSREGTGSELIGGSVPSQEIFEIVLGADALPDPEHVGRQDVRVQLHEVALAAPLEALLADEVVHLVGLRGIDLQIGDGDVDPPRLRAVRVEV